MINLKENTLLREIPDNLLIDEKVVNLAKSLQGSLNEMLDWSDKINYTTNLDVLDDKIIEHLLWEKHIGPKEGLGLATTREQKINLIKNAIELHRIKGTPAAVELVFKAVNLPFELEEWFLYGGEPYHFRAVTEKSLANVDIDSIISMIMEFKNVRSHLESITVNRKMDFGIFFGGATSNYLQTHISPPKFEMLDLESNIYYGALVSKYETTEISTPLFTMTDLTVAQSYGGVFSTWKQTTILAKGVI